MVQVRKCREEQVRYVSLNSTREEVKFIEAEEEERQCSEYTLDRGRL